MNTIIVNIQFLLINRKLKDQEQTICTKATSVGINRLKLPTTLPSEVRLLSSSLLKKNIGQVIVGQGLFGKCYIASIGPLKACAKVFRLDEEKYYKFFCKEVWMLLQLCHENLPWIIAACNDSCMKAIIMSFHPFRSMDGSVTVHTALKENTSSLVSHLVTNRCWKNILLGLTSALVYLKNNSIIHNDIKTDNVLIEFLPPNESICRSVLIDFGKACFESEAASYSLSKEQIENYKKYHPQVAPELRSGTSKQSFSSDIYSFGRILHQINTNKLNIPVLNSLSEQCLSHSYKDRPTAQDLHTFFSNLFVD